MHHIDQLHAYTLRVLLIGLTILGVYVGLHSVRDQFIGFEAWTTCD
jgi:hypothetical protein